MSWLSTLGTVLIGVLRALAVIGAYMAGRNSAKAKQDDAAVAAGEAARARNDSIRAASDAELDERLRKYTHK